MLRKDVIEIVDDAIVHPDEPFLIDDNGEEYIYHDDTAEFVGVERDMEIQFTRDEMIDACYDAWAEHVELELRDSFGKLYTVDAIAEKEIRERIAAVNIEEVVQLAYGAYVLGTCDGVCYMDITTGELTSGSYSTGSYEIQGAHLIELDRVSMNLDLSAKDLLTDDEQKEYAEEADGGIYDVIDYCEKHNIDYDERKFEALFAYANGYIGSELWWRGIDEQLERCYDEGGDC